MTSSSDPHNEPASRPLRFIDAVRLHARRFNRHPLGSAVRLVSADQRISHPEGGIALLNETGHVARATALFLATYLPTTAGLFYGLITSNLALVAAAAPLSTISGVYFGSRCERQIRAHRTFDTRTHPWLLSDVATEPHRRIGDQLLNEIERRADHAHTEIVLEVAHDNETAKTLYLRHQFTIGNKRASRLTMRRTADPT